jgi:nicotinate-nucleotide adenylyltransferase
MRIGLMGGTFDPVHLGHLLIAEVARAEFTLDRVIWIPAGDPPHKHGVTITPQEYRYAMVILATASNPYFEVSRLELERKGPSYTLDTILHFAREYEGDELFFITGADAILEILTWYRHQDVIAACRFIAVTRPGYDLARLSAVLPPDYLARIGALTAPGVDISSTMIRNRSRDGDPIRYMVPDSVDSYIAKHALYAGSEGKPLRRRGETG